MRVLDLSEILAIAEDLEKSSAEEREEHPWMTGDMADRVARDHSSKMTEVFARELEE